MTRNPRLAIARHALLAAALLAVGPVPALAQAAVSSLLERIEPGAWDVRVREAGSKVEHICVRAPDQLIQLRHPGTACQKLVVEETPSLVTVQYTCPGRGYGRTTVRLKTTA